MLSDRAFCDSWWALGLRGLMAAALALLALLWPHPTLELLALAFGVFVITDGALRVVGSWSLPWAQGRLLVAGAGLVAVGAGLFVLEDPGLREVSLMRLIAVWALASGVIESLAGFRLWRLTGVWRPIRRARPSTREWSLLAAGTASLALGVAALLPFRITVPTLALLIGLVAVTLGYLRVRAGLALGGLALAGRDGGAFT